MMTPFHLRLHAVICQNSQKLQRFFLASFTSLCFMTIRVSILYYIGGHYSPLITLCVGNRIVAVVDSSRSGHQSIYHVDCEVLVPQGMTRCPNCTRHRNVLRAMVSRSRYQRDDNQRTHPSSRTLYCALSTPKKKQRLHRLSQESKHVQLRLERLQKRINMAACNAAVPVD